jgi:hypothetical protein
MAVRDPQQLIVCIATKQSVLAVQLLSKAGNGASFCQQLTLDPPPAAEAPPVAGLPPVIVTPPMGVVLVVPPVLDPPVPLVQGHCPRQLIDTGTQLSPHVAS